jgi:regulator of cell morphogenesis and NO signaling
MQIEASTPVGRLAVELPQAIPVFEKWNIDYCCHGTQSLQEAAQAAGVEVGELVRALGSESVPEAPESWSRFSLSELQTYIVATHHRFTRDALDTVVKLSLKVAGVHGTNHPETVRVAAFVNELNSDLIPHMLKEEQVLFPYVEALEKATAGGYEPPMPFFGTVRNPIRMMMSEHETVAEIFAEIRQTTSEFQLPPDACVSFRALYERLSELEQDLHRHIHLENNVLFPRAAEMEESHGTEFAGALCGDHCGGH